MRFAYAQQARQVSTDLALGLHKCIYHPSREYITTLSHLSLTLSLFSLLMHIICGKEQRCLSNRWVWRLCWISLRAFRLIYPAFKRTTSRHVVPIVTFTMTTLAFWEDIRPWSTRQESTIWVLQAKDGSFCLRGTEILDILRYVKSPQNSSKFKPGKSLVKHRVLLLREYDCYAESCLWVLSVFGPLDELGRGAFVIEQSPHHFSRI